MMRAHRMQRTAVVAAALALLVAACGNDTPAADEVADEVSDEVSEGAAASPEPSGGGALDDIREAGTLRVANTQTNPPFSFVDESNEVVGYDVDVAKELAGRMGIDDVEFVVGTFQTFIPGLEADKWDVVVSGLTVTEERKAQVDFSCPYQVSDVSIFVAPGTEGVTEEADLSGLKVAVTAGGTQEELARGIEGTSVLTYDNATLALQDVGTGRADAYIGAKFTGAYLAEQNGLAVEPAEGYLSREVNAMAFPKGQDDVVEAANEALASMVEDGTLSEISETWLGGLDMVEGLEELPEC